MKNPFKRNRIGKNTEQNNISDISSYENDIPETTVQPTAAEKAFGNKNDEIDSFSEWGRSQIHGGIERRERNDIFEAYNVYGADGEGNLIVRRYHRYPEHEKDFDLSYSRKLSFEDFNRRLLSELDIGDIKADMYTECIKRAEKLIFADASAQSDPVDDISFSEEEEAILRGFCDSIDILQNKSYLHSSGVFSCECESIIEEERLNIRFRKPLKYDAMLSDISGVKKEKIDGYEIDDLWVMGVYNRIYERCSLCEATRLTSEWSIEKESLYLIRCEGFENINGVLLTAVGRAESFRKFGFFSLDFSKK